MNYAAQDALVGWFCKLGIIELFGQQYHAITSNHVNRVVESLQVELATSLTDGTFSDDQSSEMQLIDQALSSLENEKTIKDCAMI